jgi:molybdopterin molybdotransferase
VAGPLHSVEEAQAIAVAAARSSGPERIAIDQALGRVLAETVMARVDLPPGDDSAMDGYAVRAADVTGPEAELRVVGESAAGHAYPAEVSAGQTVRIMTGALVPAGADAVVMVEDTTVSGDRVRVRGPAHRGQHIRPRGDHVRSGDLLLAPGTWLSPAAIGVLASQQRSSITVARRPEVAILATGDELRDLDQPLANGTIADSNSRAVAALVRQAGGIPWLQPLIPDEPGSVRAAMEAARSADLIVSIGGVSVGEHDHVKAVLGELGGKIALWRVAMKPGKPLVLAHLGATPFYGLPGNPVSSMVSFLLFVRPAIRAALGCTAAFDLPRAEAVLDSPLRARADRRAYLRARLRFDADVLKATPMSHQGSGALTAMLGANGLVVVEPGTAELSAGAKVGVLIIGPL